MLQDNRGSRVRTLELDEWPALRLADPKKRSMSGAIVFTREMYVMVLGVLSRLLIDEISQSNACW